LTVWNIVPHNLPTGTKAGNNPDRRIKMTTDTNNVDRDAVLRRVQKLLAIAQDDRADPNEAAAAARMAETVMRKYQIDMAETLVSRIKQGDDLSSAEYVATAKTNGTPVRSIAPWAQWIAVGVGKLMDCGVRLSTTSKGEACVKFFGYTADVQVSIWMVEYLVATTNSLCNNYKKTEAYARFGRTQLNSYRQGVATGICGALGAALRAKQAENQTSSAGTALVVVKQNAITEKFGDFGYNSRNHVTRSASAFSAGVADGRKVDVTRRAVGTAGGQAVRRLT
jgi:hypothetical protein